MNDTKQKTLIANALIVVATICIGVLLGEITFRVVDGYRLDSLPLVSRVVHVADPATASLHYAEQLHIDPSFNVSWYTIDPPNYDRNPKTVPLPADWANALAHYRPQPGEPVFLTDELKFLYNYNWLAEACRTGEHANYLQYYKRDPGFVYAFASPDKSTDPPFRLAPRRGWGSSSDYYNNFGFRGPDIVPNKAARTIRIAFLGASTSANGWPFTYPEFAVHFLQEWADAEKLNVHFEVLNAGRAGEGTPVMVKIMRYEVAPLHPDIVVFYDNDLHIDGLVRVNGTSNTTAHGSDLQPNIDVSYLPFEQYSALLDRIYELVLRRGGPAAEPPKPPHELTFDLSQKNPNLDDPNLPLRLHPQVVDLRSMADAAKQIHAQFALTSSVTLVHDGIRLDPESGRIALRQLNVAYYPLTYKEIREATDFQNTVYQKLAQTDGHLFIDVNKYFPQEPSFFADTIHFNTQDGFRLQGWIVAQLLAPYLRQQIGQGALPKPAYQPKPSEIAWATAPPIRFSLGCLPAPAH